MYKALERIKTRYEKRKGIKGKIVNGKKENKK